MILSNTDSLMCKTEAEDVYEDVCKDKELFDFINYPRDSKHHDIANSLIKWKMKTCGVPIIGFVGLKFKMYTFITEGNQESKKAKEIKP